MTFGAIEFLSRYLQNGMKVFEYGSGGSSVFFAERGARVITVEHDASWAGKVREAVASGRLKHCDVLVREPRPGAIRDPGDPYGYCSSADLYRGSSFHDYAAAIDRFTDGYFDMVVLDGRARPSCALHAIDKVVAGGCIVLDNAERSHYRWIHSYLAGHGWSKRVFGGPGPYNEQFWQTCVWRRAA